MGIVRKLRDGAKWIENVSEFEAPRPRPDETPAESTQDTNPQGDQK